MQLVDEPLLYIYRYTDEYVSAMNIALQGFTVKPTDVGYTRYNSEHSLLECLLTEYFLSVFSDLGDVA